MPRLVTVTESATRILDVAERLVQTRGFNAFSYADVAVALNVTKASLHYHFSTKAELGARLIERYRSSFTAALERIGQACPDVGARLNAYVQICIDVLDNDRMCLCGILAAEYATLPAAMQQGVQQFFDANEAWLVDVLVGGREQGQIGFDGPPIEVARLIIAALEGAMLVARSCHDSSRLRSVGRRLLADLGVKGGSPYQNGPS